MNRLAQVFIGEDEPLELRRPPSSISPPVFQRLLWYDWRKTSSGQQRNSSLAQKYPAHQMGSWSRVRSEAT